MIVIIDFGSQFNQLIARRVREHNVYCQIEPAGISIDRIKDLEPTGLILSGGPASVYEENSPAVDPAVFELGIPILGICYGMHYMVHQLGGKIKQAKKKEYGFAKLRVNEQDPLFKDMGSEFQCWMSHGDSAIELPQGFEITASTDNCPIAAISNYEKQFFGLQLHPEVEHSVTGSQMINHFLMDICKCKQDWSMQSFAKQTITQIKETVGSDKVIMGLSGGVDSSVAATLIHKAVSKNLHCIFVDNGLLRKNEKEDLQVSLLDNLDMNISFVDATDLFLNALKDITDPEEKRKIIGRLFIEVFEAEANKIEDAHYLGQGTLYPDIIESKSAFGGPTDIIKSHHNVGGLPEKMKLKLIEPLQLLFKDEVRKLGTELGINDQLIWRQPFPGPGLAIRIMGAVTRERLDVLREADAILLEEIKAAGLYRELWQSFAVLLPVKSVGVMGDKRTFANCVAIRAVTSNDAMTADWAKLPHDLLGKISNRIINEVDYINRVVFDITSKPPGTIEWE
ncbi:MAG: glutamine-hydrolyzing GMP synthase [Desulfobacteraceae bacterium]|nr:MAG: glutamine-hydrolyzing GMP synthase [Desulfobacteraceae bacterium]